MTKEEYTGEISQIPYYDGLLQGEKAELRDAIRLLLKQTFILEHRYDKRSSRFIYNQEFKVCNKHLEFIRAYLAVSGINVLENSQLVSSIYRVRIPWEKSCQSLLPFIYWY